MSSEYTLSLYVIRSVHILNFNFPLRSQPEIQTPTPILVPNRWNQTLCLVPSPAINKRGESAGWLSEQVKDGITTSLSLSEHPDSERRLTLFTLSCCRKYYTTPRCEPMLEVISIQDSATDDSLLGHFRHAGVKYY